jgi:hypothetical protein
MQYGKFNDFAYSYARLMNDTLMIDMFTLNIMNEARKPRGYKFLYIITVPLDIVLTPFEIIWVIIHIDELYLHL